MKRETHPTPRQSARKRGPLRTRLPRWMAARYEPRLFGLGTVLEAAGLSWFWVVALEMGQYGPVVVPPMLVVALGIVAATVDGLPVWVRHFDLPTRSGADRAS
jgi:hypothetical protein